MKKIKLMITLLCVFYFTNCKKENNSVTINLSDKPLSVIQSYVNGKWKLQYTMGGYTGGSYPAIGNSYLTFSTNKIRIQNDTAITVDTTLSWSRIQWGTEITDSAYLFSYMYSQGYGFKYNYFIDRIFNDTLEFHDYASDPIYYYYSKTN